MNRAAGRGSGCARSLTPAAAALLAACGLLTALPPAEAAAAAGKTGCPCLSHCTPESIPVYHTGSSSGDSVCYRMVSFANANWEDAQRVCRQDGGRLAEPRSAAEVAFLWSTVSNEFQYVWVGARAAVAPSSDAASWGWASDGAAVVAGVRPSAAAQDGACAFISERGPGSGGLFSWACAATMAFICEKPRISFDAGVVRLTLREAWGARAGSPPVRVPLAGTGLGGGGVYVAHARVSASTEVPDAAAQQAACAAHAAAAPIRTAADVRARMRALPTQAAGAHVYTPPETEVGGAGLEAGTTYAVCWFGPLAADAAVASSAPLALQASGVVLLTAGSPTLAVADNTLVLTEDSVRCEGEGEGARCPGRTAVAGANLEPGMLLSLGCDPGRFPELLFEVRAATGGGGGLSVVFNDAKADFAGLTPDVQHDVCVVVWGVPGGGGGSGWDALPRAERRAAAARIPQAAFVSTPARVVRRKAPSFSGEATRFLTYYESVQKAAAVRIRITTAGLPLAAAVPGQTLLLGLYAGPSCAGALLHHAPAAYDEAAGGAPVLVVDPAAAAAAGFALRAHKLLHVCYAAARVPVAAVVAAQSGYPGTHHVFRPTGVRVKVADRPRIERGTGADAGAVFMRLAAGGVGASRALSVNVTARYLSLPSAAESSTLFWVAYAAAGSPDASCDDTDAFYTALGGTLAALAVPAGGAAPLRNAATTPVGASLTLPPPGSVAAGAAAQRYCVVLVAAAPDVDGFASDAALRSFVQARVTEDDAASLRRYVIAAGVRLDVLPPPVFAAPEPPLLRRPSWAQRTTASGSGSGSNDAAGKLALSGTYLAPPSGLLFAAVAAESCAAAASDAVFAPVAAAPDASLALRQFLPLGAGGGGGSVSVHAVCWRYDAAAAPEGVANAWRDTGDTVVVAAPPVVQRYVSAAAAPGAKQTVAAGELDARLDIPVFGQLLPNGTAVDGVLTYSLERQPPGSGGDGGLHGPYVLRCAPASMDGALPDLPAAAYGRPPFCSSAVVAIGGTAAAAGSLLPPNTYRLLERRGAAAAATDTGVTVVVGPRPEVSAAAVQTVAHDALAECAAGTRQASVQVSVRHHTPRLTLGIRLDGETAVLALGAPTTVPPSGEGADPNAAVSVAFQLPRAVCGEAAALLAARRAASDAGGGAAGGSLDAQYELVWGHGDRPGFDAAVEGGGGAPARLLGKGRPLFARTVPSAEALRVDAGLAALFRRDAAGGAAVALGGAVDTLNADQALLGVLCEHPSCGYAACAGSSGVLLFDLSTPAQAGASPVLRLPFAYYAARGDRSLFVCWAAAYGGDVAPPQAQPRALSTAAWAAELAANPALDAAARRMRPARVTVALPSLPRFAAAAVLPALRYALLPQLVAELPGVFPEAAAAAAVILHLAPPGGSCGAADAAAPLSAAATQAAGPTLLNVTAAGLLAPAVLPGARYPVCYSVVAAANAAAAAGSFPSQHRLYHALAAGSLVFEHVAAPAPVPVVEGGGGLVVRIVDAAATAAGGGTRVLLRGAGLTPDVVAREAMPGDACEAGYTGQAKWVFDVQAAAVPAAAGSGGGVGDATAFFTHRAGGTSGTTLAAAYSGGARRLCWGVRRLAGGSDASVVTWLPGGSPFTYQAPPAFRNANLPLSRESLLGFAAAGGGGFAANTVATAGAWGSGLGVAAPFYVHFVPPVKAQGGVVDAAASCAAAVSGGGSNLHGFLVDAEGTLHLPPALSTHLFYSGSSGAGARAVCWAGSSSGASFLQATAATMTAPVTPSFITATSEVAAVRLLELFKMPAAPSLFGFLVDMQGGPDASTALKYWLSLGTTHHSPTNAATSTDKGLAEQPPLAVDAATHTTVSTYRDAQLSTDTAAVAGYLQRALLTGEAAEGAAAGRRVEVSLRLWWGLAGADGQWRPTRDGRSPLVLRGRTAADPHVASVRRVWQIPRVSGAEVRLKGVAGGAAAAALRVEEAPGLGRAPPLLPQGAWHDASGGAALGAFFDARVAAAGPDAAAFASVLCHAGAVDALGLRVAAAGAAALRLSAADVAALSGGIVVSRVAGAGHAVTADVHGLAVGTAYVVLTGVLARASSAANSPVLFHPISVFPVTVHPSTDTAAPPTSAPTPVPADATPSPTPAPPQTCDAAGEATAATRVSEVCNHGGLRRCLAPAAATPVAQCAAAYTACAAREQAAAEAALRCAVAEAGAGTPVRGHVVLSVSVDAFDATLFRAALAEADEPRRLPQRFGVVRVSPGSAVVEFTAPSLDVLGKKLAGGGADAPASPLFQAYNWSVLGYSGNGTGGLTAAPQVVELPPAEDSDDDKMRLVLFVGLSALLCVVLIGFALLVRCCCRVERAVEETKKQIEGTVAAQQAKAQQPADECEVTVEFSDEEGEAEAAAAAPKPLPRGPPVPPRRSESRSRAGSEDTQPAPGVAAASAVSIAATPSLTVSDGSGGGGRLQRLKPTDDPFAGGPTEPTSAATNLSKVKGISRKPDCVSGGGGGGFADLFRTAAAGAPAEHPFKPAFAAAAAHVQAQAQAQAGAAAQEPQSNGGRFDFFRTAQPKLPAASSVSAPASAPSTTIVSVPSRSAASAPIPAPTADGSLLSRLAAHPETVARVHSSKPRGLRPSLSSAQQQPHPSASARPQTSLGHNSSIVSVPSHQGANTTTISVPSVSAATDYPPVFVSGSRGPPQPPPRLSHPAPPPHAHARPQPAEPQAKGAFLTPPAASLSTSSGLPCCHHCGHPWNGGAFCAYCGRQSA